MAKGGARQGQPRKAYQNRTDLNQPKAQLPVQTATGQQYGQATQQAQSQAVVPMRPQPAIAHPATGQPMPVDENFTPAGQVVPLNAPSLNPDQPVTAGIATGAGPGPEALHNPNMFGDQLETKVRAIFSKYPDNEDVRLLLRQIDDSKYYQDIPNPNPAPEAFDDVMGDDWLNA